MTDATPAIDLAALDQYLRSGLAPAGCLGVSGIDGVLTGTAIGPEPVRPDEWLAAIWHGAEPEFASEAQRQQITGAIMSRYDTILAQVRTDFAAFEPILMPEPSGDPGVLDWAAGFLDGVALRRQAWQPLLRHRRASLLLHPLLILGANRNFEDQPDAMPHEQAFYASRPHVIQLSVRGINDFWRDWQSRQQPMPRRERRARPDLRHSRRGA